MRTKLPVKQKISSQVRNVAMNYKDTKKEIGNFKHVISTGSTLLDLAISGGVHHGGGLPGGILVEIFGPPSCGKTLLLCEIAGAVQRKGGDIMFFDPEARLNRQYARRFGMKVKAENYIQPDTVPEVFMPVRKWEVDDTEVVNGVFADSLAALSTKMEMEEGDKMGMRRAKEFSEELRKTCRVLAQKNYLMVCSNQVRENTDAANKYSPKYRSIGGQAIPFYASLRLRCSNATKIPISRTINGVKHTRIVGVETEIRVEKSSLWNPFGIVTVPILFNYGVDDVRQNLSYIKDCTKASTFMVGDVKLTNSLEHACHLVERDHLQSVLKEAVITIWEDIESNFVQDRAPKYE